MSLKELDPQRAGRGSLRTWLSQVSIPVVILAWSDWRRKADCEEMMKVIEDLASDPKYSNAVLFYWFNPDEDGPAFGDLSINDTPCAVIFKNGQEVAKFTSASSKDAITYQLSILLDPTRGHTSSPAKTTTHKEVSSFHP